MASTTALYTGLSGLLTNSRDLDVIGNNIANVNTTGYKSSRLMFQSMYARSLSTGSPPGDSTGGTNPSQIGMGVRIAGTQRNFTSGSTSTTGDPRDMAIEGDGFFVVERGGTRMYTRNGAFRPDAKNILTGLGGEQLMGYGVDSTYKVIKGSVGPLSIPIGGLTAAEATKNVRMTGNLNAGGSVPTKGSVIALGGTTTAGYQAIASANPPVTSGDKVETNTRLVDLEDPSQPGSNTPYFQVGQQVQISGVQKGGKTLPTATLAVTSTTTVQDLMDFMKNGIGMNTTVGANPDGKTPGVTLDPLTGMIQVVGNTGSANDLVMKSDSVKKLDAAGASLGPVFSANKTATADGESVRTSLTVYDSLGNEVQVDMTYVLSSKSNSGTTWQYYLESADDSDKNLVVGTGSLQFDTSGQLITTTPVQATVDRAGTGADTPLSFQIDLATPEQNVTALTDRTSKVEATFRDGAPIGSLASYSVGQDGTLTGSFTNGLTRTVGQVALATFVNPEGLVDQGGGMFAEGTNSGTAVVSSPLDLGAGKVLGGSLELSNVDLGQEFINMILAQTGYSASTRIISTTNELMQQLLQLAR